MTYAIWADQDTPPPRPVHCIFACDGDHGFLEPVELRVEIPPAGPDAWTLATACGWLVLPERQLCPACRRRLKH